MSRAPALALALVLALACSRPLEGAHSPGPVADWSAVLEPGHVELATPSGQRFRTVLAEPFVHDGQLHLHVYTIFTRSDAALNALLRDGRLDLLENGRVHPLRAVQLTTAAEIDPVLPSLLHGMGMQVTAPHWDPTPARYPGTQVKQWLFRLEPTSG